MLQSKISSPALETCPARHEQNCAQEHDLNCSSLEVPGAADWIFWSQLWIPWLKLKQINQTFLIHTTAQVNLLKEGGWQNHVMRACSGVTLRDLQARGQSCSSAVPVQQYQKNKFTKPSVYKNYHPNYLTWSALPGLCMSTKWIVVW